MLNGKPPNSESMTTILIDGGYFVGRFEKHWFPNPRRKNMKYWWEQKKMNKITTEVRDANLFRLFAYDITYLQMKIAEINPLSTVIVCYDGIYGRRPRGALYPEYKQNRRGGAIATKHKGIDVRYKIKRTKHDPEGLVLGWQYEYDDNKEADDLIAELCISLPDDEEIIVMSKDGDLIQLMALPNVSLHDFTIPITDDLIMEKYGITPSQYLDFKALVGDKSDNIPGIKGIGPATAKKYLSEYDTIDNFPQELLAEADISKANLWKRISTLPFHQY